MPFFMRFVFALLIIAALGAGTTYGIYAYSVSFAFSPTTSIVSPIRLSQAITIDFEKPIATKDYREKISIVPNRAIYADWNSDSTKLTLTPQSFWLPETTYTISLPEGTTKTFATVKPSHFSFQTIPYPKVIDIFPKDGSKDLLLGIEDPITVTLQDMSEDFFIDFRFDPKRDIAYENNEDKTQFKLLPKTPLEEGGSYKLDIYVNIKKDVESSRIIGSSNFTTQPPAPQTWPKNINERLEQAKRYTKPKIETAKYIDINIAAQVMSIFENGTLLDSFAISSGRRGMDTPKGTFSVHNKSPRPWSKQYSLYMPYWMAITGDGKFGIHELPEWPGGYKEGANHLGIPVSHGCVRLGIGPAKRVFEWADIGTPIVIY